MDLISMIVLGIVFAAVALFAAYKLIQKTKEKSAPQITQHIHSSIEEMRSVGELTVYRAFTKEIVTQTDHSWGEFGAKYLSWVLSKKKMAMIFEFEISFLYNLLDSQFKIVQQEQPNNYLLEMPMPTHDVKIKSIQFYDEQDARLLPWLLPDLLNKAFSGAFSQQDKNTLMEAARKHASEQAISLIERLRPEVESSAKNTLASIARSFGAEKITFAFHYDKLTKIDVHYPNGEVLNPETAVKAIDAAGQVA